MELILPSSIPKEDVMRTRAVKAGAGPFEQAVGALMPIVQAEYAEMPGLCVTPAQAQRLWAVDRAVCDEVFRRLIARGVVRMTARGPLVRA